MPIPGLSVKTQSPRDWKRRSRHRNVVSSRGPHYTGRPPGRRWAWRPKLFRSLGTTILVGIVGVGVIGVLVLAWVARDLPNPNRIINRQVAESTKIYDRTGETLLYDIHGNEKRTLIPLAEIPKYLVDATLTAEDRNFYNHRGFSLTGMLRSAIRNVTTGSRVGGSTLTQQLIKNAILSSEKTYTRKIKELILAYQIERKFSKDEILQLYFNEIPYGSVAYGAEAATQTYFGKSVRDITLAQAAILAALPQAPTYYSPFGSHTDQLFARQQYILDSMAELGYITEQDAELAKAEKVEFTNRVGNIVAPHFVMYVREYLTERYGELVVEQGGLQVVTTLDVDKQKAMEETITELAEKNLAWNASNAAAIALDAPTGQILGMVGSKDYFNDDIDGQVNVTIRPRQPGSSFKPIVYTAAFLKGFTPETVLYDVNTKFINYDGRDYEPKNYSLNENGPVTIRKALAGSLNIPAVKAIYLAGIDEVIDLAEALGYSTLSDRSRFGLSLVLGGGEVKLLEHAAAFGALAREGEGHPVSAILEVRDKNDEVLEKFKRQDRKVLDTQVARQTTSILSDNNARAYIFGEKNYLTLGSRPVAAKTGTTNDYKDAWTIGYTPSLVVGVWVGNNNNEEMKRGADGSVIAAPIWNRIMQRLLEGQPVESFTAPKEEESSKPALNGQVAEGLKVRVDSASGKLATNLTPESMVEERVYRQAHSILYYVNKDDPRGDTAPDRGSPQFLRWEEAVQRWATANSIVTEEPPTEYDDVHTLANLPRVQITSPRTGQSLTSRQLSATVSVSAPRGVRRVEYLLNDRLIATASNPPFNIDVSLADSAISSGQATLKAVAYDDVGNSRSDTIALNLSLPALPSTLTWTEPAANSGLASDDFPITLRANLTNTANISEVKLFFRSAGGQTGFINNIRQFSSDTLSAQWFQAPAAGSYEISAEVVNRDGFSYTAEPLPVVVSE